MPNLRTIVTVHPSAICGFSPWGSFHGVGFLVGDLIYGVSRLDAVNQKEQCSRWVCLAEGARHNVDAPQAHFKLDVILQPSYYLNINYEI